MTGTIRVAAIQARPVFLDKGGSVDKAVRLIGEAAGRGVVLAAFGETWIPGYPAWLDLCPGAAYWDHAPAKKAYARLRENSIVIPGPETEALGGAAKQHRMVLSIGAHERVETGPGHGSLYNAQILLGPDGRLLAHRRKLVPTHAERLVWASGDARDLGAAATPAGRVGALICWEHWMPLARQAVHEAAEQIHVAAWPSVGEPHLLASRHYAFEGRCFVLAVGQIIAAADLPAGLEPPPGTTHRPDELLYNGGSCIIGPDGAILAGPVVDREEIVIADLDFRRIAEESMALDVTGHYNRPDLFEFKVRKRE
ncbi:MAG: carbon-nitrogen hydrolase family protein [Candidatus Polarisedimenticolia bacterium]